LEILRIPSYQPEINLVVGSPLADYEYTVVDLADSSNTVGTVASNTDSEVTVPLPPGYDGSYSILVDNQEIFVDIVRPYVDPTTKGETASEIAEYRKHEELARAIIDSVVDEGFYYKKKIIETTGLGSDYIPLWINAVKVLKLYENNVLMYDSENPDDYSTSYEVTKDKTAIVESYPDRINRLEGAQLVLPAGGSDLLDIKYAYRGFPRTFDYRILVSEGYQRLPSDIVRATELLVEDIACGKLDYYQRYIKAYNTDQFKIQFDDSRVFEGTGNILVDKILSKYAKSIRKIGVL
jgi:hypothetical protein